jgi:archaellum biogenesis ATPase FlaH/CheY-like chemotaxis protein
VTNSSREAYVAKILIADRAPNVRRMVASVLTPEGHTVIEAANGIEVLTKAAKEGPELILVDSNLPGTTGLDVVGKLKENAATEGIPVIVMGESTRGESAALGHGAVNYLIKPLRGNAISTAIRVALRDSAKTATAKPEEGAEPEGIALPRFISTGLLQLDQILKGGVPVGSLALIEGSPGTGKSVLCQQVAQQALRARQGVAYFVSQGGPERLLSQMAALGLDPSRYVKANRLRILPLPAFTEESDTGETAKSLVKQVEGLPDSNKVVILDSLTDLVRFARENALVGTFAALEKLSKEGRTIVVEARAYAFQRNVLPRVHALCNTHLALRDENLGNRTVKAVEVTKARNVDVKSHNVVNFEVAQGVGMQYVPGGKVRA